MSVEMKIQGLMMDPVSQMPIIILKNADGDAVLPIWVGIFEANAIALRIEEVDTPRPMTHDLMRSFLKDLGAQVDRVLICDLKDNTFFAEIHLTFRKRELTVDSRPSDALALAVRAEAPIFVLRPVLEKAQAIDLTERLSRDERLKKWLEDADPEDLCHGAALVKGT